MSALKEVFQPFKKNLMKNRLGGGGGELINHGFPPNSQE